MDKLLIGLLIIAVFYVVAYACDLYYSFYILDDEKNKNKEGHCGTCGCDLTEEDGEDK
jgi:hypothetical protein